MTPTEFKTLKPQFAAVSDDVVVGYISMANRIVFDPDDVDALAALTCHFMTLDGLGTDAQSESFLEGTAEFQSIRSGQLTLTRFQAQSSGSAFGDWLKQTACGRYYAILLKLTRGGPRVARGGGGHCRTAYAKDGWPLWVDNA